GATTANCRSLATPLRRAWTKPHRPPHTRQSRPSLSRTHPSSPKRVSRVLHPN
ncbi:hypothetical protein Csa_017033, partial [Cucumis sativus]